MGEVFRNVESLGVSDLHIGHVRPAAADQHR